ncbi:T-cell immunomodulatory protein like protein precursor [Angomonas deanei]|nr:T-cell immunomodulatory protein like protein precursor [Angomonas deanei]|eukprot:EPY41410.1 T-cell immunomodulatory protein like protein precursor [Angomonas deanei]
MEDINGDCLAELVFTVRDVQNAAVEVFMVSPGKRQQLRLERLLTLEESCGEEELCYYGTPTVADVTGDGVPDITFPVCSQEHQTEDSDALFAEGCVAYEGVQVFRNQLEASKACAKAGGAPGPYGFATERSTTTVLKAASCGFTDEVLLTTSLKEPLLLRPLDYNRDGVTDLAVPSTQGPLLLSGTGGVFDCTPVDSSKAVDDTTYQASIPFFLSLEVLGRFELLLNSPTNNTVYTHHNIPQRHYFLLASALNGVYGEKQNQFALTQTGAVHYWSWQDIHMKSHYNLQTQAARTGVRALSPPRVFAGLGVTFSYVEHYTVGTAVAGERRYRRFPSYLIPNSQVFAVLHPIQQDSEWSLQLYVPTSQYKLLLLVVLLSTLTILGIPIACMRWSELRSDMREWRLL